MEFGAINKVDELNAIKLDLPADHPDTIRILDLVKSASKSQVFVGLPITSHPAWIGTIYPPKPKNDLLHYAKQFNSLEVNSTGYMAPSASTIEKWIKDTPEGFKFCPKIPRNISQRLAKANVENDAFCASLRKLGNKLGICFLQFSDNFAAARFNDLADYISIFPKDIPLAIELRHESWFKNDIFEKVSSLLEENNITFIITDVALRRDVLHMRLTTPTAFIRFNGYDLHAADFKRLDDWALRLKSWLENGLQTLYFFVHIEDKKLNPELSNYMINKLNTLCGMDLKNCVYIKSLFD